MELIIIIILGLIAIGFVVNLFVCSYKKEKSCYSKYETNCNNCKLKDIDKHK